MMGGLQTASGGINLSVVCPHTSDLLRSRSQCGLIVAIRQPFTCRDAALSLHHGRYEGRYDCGDDRIRRNTEKRIAR